MSRIAGSALAGALALTAGCTWVTPSPEAQGADIAVVDATTAARCQLLTQNQLSVDAKLGVLQRMPTDVEHDLQTMAINQAASVGANAVAALSPAKDGVQTWGIYKCPASVKSAAAPSVNPAPAAGTGVHTIPYTPPR